MSNKIKCTCGHSWNKSDSSKKDATVCHICGKNNMKNGGWLDAYDNVPQAENGIEGTMGGLTDQGFNYNGAWGGTMQTGGSLEKIKSILNPFNWGVEDYTDEGDFKKAYSSAKKSGEKEFMYKDKRYNTKYAGTPRQEVGTYGVDGKPVHPMDINHPSQVNLYPAFGKYLPGHVSAMVSTDPESASVDYSSTGNMPWGIGVAKNKGESSYFVYGNDQEKFYNKAASLPTGNYFVEDEYTPSDWNLLTNNCADNVCDAFGIPRNKGIQTPSGAVSKIKENYPTLDVTGRTQKDYSNLVKDLDKKDVLKNSDKLTSIYFSPDTENKLKKDIGSKIQKALINSGYDLPKSYIKGNKWNVDKVLGDETLTALKDWQKKNKSLAMGGGIPGAVGFTYARTAGAVPSNGPYAKKTKASAQNGKEMKFYQAGLDFKPKTISQDGSEIPVDPMGYWNPENVGNPVIIPSNEITMEGVDQPLIGISDTGDVQYMYPGEDYTFDGESVTEYPVMQKGGRTPIYTENPKDKRIKAYQDSLSLYNQTLGNLKAFKKYLGWQHDDATLRSSIIKYSPNAIAHMKASSKATEWYASDEENNDPTGTRESTYSTSGYKNKVIPTILPVDYYAPQWSDNAFSRIPRYKKPEQPVVYKKPEPKKEVKKPEPVKKEQAKPVVERRQNIYEGSPVYSPGAGSGMRSALVGFLNKQGDTTYIKPEDYERFAVPKYGKQFIESKKKQRNGGVNKADEYPIEKLDQSLNFTNYNKPTKGGWLDKYN